MMITATGMGFAMNAIRLWCFATLGDHFDSQVKIKKAHRLITRGPYSFVRRPSYMSGYGVFIAVTLAMFSEDHWFSRRARQSVVGRAVGRLWFVELAILRYNFLGVRTNVADEGLKKHFGKEWDEWAARVPYRIFPYIY